MEVFSFQTMIESIQDDWAFLFIELSCNIFLFFKNLFSVLLNQWSTYKIQLGCPDAIGYFPTLLNEAPWPDDFC